MHRRQFWFLCKLPVLVSTAGTLAGSALIPPHKGRQPGRAIAKAAPRQLRNSTCSSLGCDSRDLPEANPLESRRERKRTPHVCSLFLKGPSYSLLSLNQGKTPSSAGSFQAQVVKRQ